MTFTVQPIHYADIESVWKQHVWPNGANIRDYIKTDGTKDLNIEQNEVKCFGLYSGGTAIMGVISCFKSETNAVRMRGLWIDASLKGSGASTALIDAVAIYANSIGCAQVWEFATSAGRKISLAKLGFSTLHASITPTGKKAPGNIMVQTLLTMSAPGTMTVTTPGKYRLVVPRCTRLDVELWGAGASGSGANQATSTTATIINGQPGTYSRFNKDAMAKGGTASANANAGGAGGGAKNADIGTPGGAGGVLSGAYAGAGGTAANGGVGGLGCHNGYTTPGPGLAGAQPGGGGGGGWLSLAGPFGFRSSYPGPGGGAGGYAKKTYTYGPWPVSSVTPLSVVTVEVGKGGVCTGVTSNAVGGNGGDGEVKITASGTPTKLTPTTSSAFNPTGKSTYVTLSNSNLTATLGSVSNYACVYGQATKSTGKFYFEVHTDVLASTNTFVGIASSSHSSGAYLGSDYFSVGACATGAIYYAGAARVATTAGKPYLGKGHILMCAADLDNHRFYFGLDGVWVSTTDPSTGSAVTFNAGNYAPAVSLYQVGDSVTLNTGGWSFVYSIPLGFSAWG